MLTFAILSRWEEPTCRSFNRLSDHPLISRLFATVSRLGNGSFWYALLGLISLRYGATGLRLSLFMLATGGLGTLVYTWLKGRLRRPRPGEVFAALHLTVPPLDRFSFPSGHTLHAASFTLLATWFVPVLGWFLVPFAVLVAASRLVLGLHYPSDVLAGALIGSSLAALAILAAPLLGVIAP